MLILMEVILRYDDKSRVSIKRRKTFNGADSLEDYRKYLYRMTKAKEVYFKYKEAEQ